MDEQKLDRIEAKLDQLLKSQNVKIRDKRYVTAKEVEALTGLDHRTILNRSSLPADNPRFIPFIRFKTRRKYFERKVIERLFHLS